MQQTLIKILFKILIELAKSGLQNRQKYSSKCAIKNVIDIN